MIASRKLLVLVVAFALGACAASRPGKPARFQGGEDKSLDHAIGRVHAYRAQTESLAAPQAGAAPMLLEDKAPGPIAEEAPKAAYAPPPAPVPPEGGQAPVHQPAISDVSPGQMLVYTANLTMAVYQVEQGLAAVERVSRELDGYLATRSDLAITIRVPRAKFEIALKAIEGSGDVLHRDIKADDVTDEFFDTEVRARNARAMRDRLAKLLQLAAVKEALEIEKELARVTQEIELLEGKLKLLRHRVAYSTINVTFRPRETTIDNLATRLPFPWLGELGLHNLLQLGESE